MTSGEVPAYIQVACQVCRDRKVNSYSKLSSMRAINRNNAGSACLPIHWLCWQVSVHLDACRPTASPPLRRAIAAARDPATGAAALPPKAAVAVAGRRGRFSNRPVGVKRFQTIHHYSVEVTRGLVLLFGIGTKALPPWESRTRRNNLTGGLAIKVTAGPSDRTNSPHPSSREGHLSTAGWISSFLLS